MTDEMQFLLPENKTIKKDFKIGHLKFLWIHVINTSDNNFLLLQILAPTGRGGCVGGIVAWQSSKTLILRWLTQVQIPLEVILLINCTLTKKANVNASWTQKEYEYEYHSLRVRNEDSI